MHQIRYFLALARTLNFTRAAEECNVTQPSLTRAIKLLEHELGGDLLRRERGLTHLTELGERMLPLLTRCHEAAAGARAVAAAMKARRIGALRLAMPVGVDAGPFAPHLTELLRAFGGLSLAIARGDPSETAEALRDGAADLGICGPEAMGWERFESWPLFRDPFRLVFPAGHRFANRAALAPADLAGERLLTRRASPGGAALAAALAAAGVAPAATVELSADDDLGALLAAGAGVAFAPASATLPAGLASASVRGVEAARDLRLYAVQGRRRDPAAAMLVTQLRAADWSRYEGRPVEGAA
jgi:DNA-binding transcriptional LysR family regulator